MMRLANFDDATRLDDPSGISSYLEGLVSGIGMRILDGPHVKTEDADPARYGHSGIILLYESHAAIHTYPALRSMFLDIFSCKRFDTGEVVSITGQTFGTFDIVEFDVLDRGHHWATDADAELLRWQGSR